jgi:hypothetical protein
MREGIAALEGAVTKLFLEPLLTGAHYVDGRRHRPGLGRDEELHVPSLG